MGGCETAGCILQWQVTVDKAGQQVKETKIRHIRHIISSAGRPSVFPPIYTTLLRHSVGSNEATMSPTLKSAPCRRVCHASQRHALALSQSALGYCETLRWLPINGCWSTLREAWWVRGACKSPNFMVLLGLISDELIWTRCRTGLSDPEIACGPSCYASEERLLLFRWGLGVAQLRGRDGGMTISSLSHFQAKSHIWWR